MIVGVIGQGYVGLPLAKALVEAGHKVHGIDVNSVLVEQIKSGISHVEDISNNEIECMVQSQMYFPTSNFSVVDSCEVVVICVPTPLKSDGSPDLSYLDSAVDLILMHLQKGVLIILESTSFPGTTRTKVFKKVVDGRNWREEDFFCAFSPERVDPLNKEWNLKNTPKLVSGINDISYLNAAKFYSTFVEKVIEVKKVEEAEFAKLIENAFRLVNISFVNEMLKLARTAKLDIGVILNAAETKPYGFQRFTPGIGAGGHCIPVDPVYLKEYANSLNTELPVLSSAIEINAGMPTIHANEVLELLSGCSSNPPRALLVGISYKPGVADLRESQAIILMEELLSQGIEIHWDDPLVSEASVGIRHKSSNVYNIVILNHSWKSKDEYQVYEDGQFYTVS
jgi:UDP-N-acetyl-D-glucosamine dehydrogenase